jgi:acyl-CoA thioester hydrolase
MDDFFHVLPMTVRARDIDPWGHVNNAVYFTYFECARIDYWCSVVSPNAAANPEDISVIIAEAVCQYHKPILFGQAMEVGTRVTSIGNSSIKLEHRIEVEGDLAATGRVVWVYYDYQTGESTRFPDKFRRRIEDFESGRQVMG